MILVHIISKDKKQAKRIINVLLNRKLILQASLVRKKVFELNNETGKTISKKRTLVICKTKALLFDTINALIRKRFTDTMPMLYCLPIIYMDIKQTDWLRNNTLKV